MNRYFRIWLPVSLAAHILLILLLRVLPAFPVASSSSPLTVMMVEQEKAAKHAVLPKPEVTPPVTPPRVKVPPPIPPQKLTVAPNTQLAWNAPLKQLNQLPARDPRVSTGGGFRSDPIPGNLPKLNPGVAPNRTEGLADRPDTHGVGANPLDALRPSRAATGLSGHSGTQGTAISMIPGAPLSNSHVGGSAGSIGGHNSPFPGNGPAGAGALPSMPGAAISSATGTGSLMLEHPGVQGGAGQGADGLMARAPRRPGNMGSTATGPTGFSIGLQPGAAPGFGTANGGGAQGRPGYPFAGALAQAGLPDTGASGGSPRGITGDTDHPGAGGGTSSGIGGQGPHIGLPSYGAAAISGPNPAYPHDAQTEKLHGVVKLKVYLNKHADFVKMEFLPNGRSMADILDNAAKNAVRKWHYRAKMQNGLLMTSTVNMEVIFVLGEQPVVKEMQ